MLVYKKYQILSLNFINEFDTAILYSKFKYISDFIFRQVQERSVFLFEMSPTKTSILYDIDPESEYHTINSKKVIYTKNWEDLLETGIEYFKMGNDGESFYWCNSQKKSAEKEFKLFINELITATKDGKSK